MFYTVLQKSGWADDGWTVDQTFTREADARAHAASHQQPNAREAFYNVAVKAHKKVLQELLDLENFVVTFSDGTKAIYPYNR